LNTLALAKLCGLVTAYLLLALLLWVLVFDGLAARIAYSPQPQITRYNAGRDTAFVYFTGTQSSGVAHSALLRDLWSTHRDVIVVEYNPKRFDGPTIVQSIYDKLRSWGYCKVILDGASLGAMLVTDLIDYDRAHGNNFEFAVMIEDGVSSADDLVQGSQAKAVARIWRAGPVSNLFTHLFWKAGFNPPPRNTLGTGVDDFLLRQHYHASSTYPLSGWTGELRYIVGHRAYRSGEYAGIPVVIMRSHPQGEQSDNDGVVKSAAADKWQDIFQGGKIIEVNGSTHIAFVEFPDLWRDSFRTGFAALPGW
jgi:hypothetical protein